MNTSVLRNIARIAGFLSVLLGFISWIGFSHSLLVPAHILLGAALVFAIMVLAYQAFRSGVSTWLVLLAVVWGIGLPIWGLAQARILPGTPLFAEISHVLCGIGAIGISEMLAVRINKLTGK